ncbi:unnamed protein product [Urochloa decumbens]|uniref:F-box domain-containing protein n=1 Tax=Urochloa decumbens TaxID=240449 RepID=A0ABC8WAG5_9POAL
MAAARRIPSAPAAAQPVLPDEILEEIFLRLDAAADLARASAACTSFLRVVSARRFLRRFRSLHPAPVLGVLDGDWFGITHPAADLFVPVEPPHLSASAARALARAADFTFSFIPDARSWWPRDYRDGRVLLSPRVDKAIASDDLVVCDPLHRRYVRIPPIPDDLTAPIPPAVMQNFQPYLVPASEDEDDKLKDEEQASFRIICAVQWGNKFIAFFFSSVNQKWELVTYHSLGYFGHLRRCYAHGCFFWVVDSERNALMLDTRGMKFSIIDLPPNNGTSSKGAAIVEAGEGRLGLLTLGDGAIDLSCMIWRNNSVGAEGWQHCKMIPLTKDCDGSNYDWLIMDAAGRYLSLMALRSDSSKCFVLDLKTMLLKRLCALNDMVVHFHLYASFPSPFAPPSL